MREGPKEIKLRSLPEIARRKSNMQTVANERMHIIKSDTVSLPTTEALVSMKSPGSGVSYEHAFWERRKNSLSRAGRGGFLEAGFEELGAEPSKLRRQPCSESSCWENSCLCEWRHWSPARNGVPGYYSNKDGCEAVPLAYRKREADGRLCGTCRTLRCTG